MIGPKLLTCIFLWTMSPPDNYVAKLNEGLTKTEIKSIYLLIIREDRGNATRHVREIKLDRSKLKDLVGDLDATRNKGLVNVEKKFTIIITTRRNREIRLVGQDKILFDRESGNYYKADFNWTIKYWNKDLTQGGF
jgi:hypothetical protein